MAKATKSTEGFVYFIHAPSVKRLKIGFTVNVNTRFNELQLGSPVKLVLLNYVRGAFQLEITLLALFDRYRIHGEWFEAAPDLLRYIKKLPEGKRMGSEELVLK